MDDKSKIPIGKPGNPEAAITHMRKVLTTARMGIRGNASRLPCAQFNTVCESYMRHTTRAFRLILLRADLYRFEKLNISSF